ncbi:MAG: histidine phosphatase family protein [Clostridiales bacterium]|nr:histidine phosphatase family protein [Clostridiales bacterium]
MLLYIVRHGETDLNVQGRLQGQVDIPLNEHGKELARITGQALCTVSFDRIFTSPLARAKETAQLIAAPSCERRGCQIPLTEDPRLMEISWGEWEKRGCAKHNFELPKEEYSLFYTDPFHFRGAPGGEDLNQVCERTGAFFRDLTGNPALRDETILISAHACSVRGLLHQVYPDPNDFWHGGVPANLAVNIVEVDADSIRLIAEDQIYYDPALSVDPYRLDD